MQYYDVITTNYVVVLQLLLPVVLLSLFLFSNVHFYSVEFPLDSGLFRFFQGNELHCELLRIIIMMTCLFLDPNRILCERK